MHRIEPYYNWQDHYLSQEDELSPFYQKEYSEFYFSESIYDHYIHPQWDNMGSATLFIKILYADYDAHYVIIELLGEWNDCLHNDIMIFKRNIIEHLMLQGINKFILIGENILTFHSSDDLYYEEWYDELEDDGWIALINLQEHVKHEFEEANIDSYFLTGGRLDDLPWRTLKPEHVFGTVEQQVVKRLEI